MATETDYRIKLQVFEGPLDLLLFLIRKNELDIYDIPIESVTRQYIDALKAMQQLDLDVAGEFFVMAATLMEIKSRLLLPKGLHAVDPNLEEDEMDPRWELVHQLLQYKKFKEAAAQLNEMAVTRQNLMERFVSDLSLAEGERPLKGVDRIELWNSFNMVLRRLAEKLVVGEIHDEQTTVADQMEWLLKKIATDKNLVFSHLFPEGVTLRRLVATFLAMLELTRLKKLRIRQNEAFSDIMIEAVIEDPLAALVPPVAPDVSATPEIEVAAPTIVEAAAPTDAPAPPPEAPAAPIEESLAPTLAPASVEAPPESSAAPTEPIAAPDSTEPRAKEKPLETTTPTNTVTE